MKEKKVVTFAQRLKFSIQAFLRTWRSDFPHKGSMAGTNISYLPDGTPAISLGEAIRRGAWVEEGEVPLVHWNWNCQVRMRKGGEFCDINTMRKPYRS